MRREERVTVQGPVKKQQPDGMSHRGLSSPPEEGGWGIWSGDSPPVVHSGPEEDFFNNKIPPIMHTSNGSVHCRDHFEPYICWGTSGPPLGKGLNPPPPRTSQSPPPCLEGERGAAGAPLSFTQRLPSGPRCLLCPTVP